MLPKAVQLPRVSHSPKFDSVVIRTPCSADDPYEYFETTLDPGSAFALAVDIMIDVRRANEWIEARKRAKG